MAATGSSLEKDAHYETSISVDSSPSSSSGVFGPALNIYNRIGQWKEALGLPNPGTVENISKEVKGTHLTGAAFDGARADLLKTLSANPMFQVTHFFALGSQTIPPSYNFGALFANQTVTLHGSVDHDGGLTGRLNHTWSQNNTTKIHAQFSSQVGHNMVQLEQDYQGSDYSLNVKAINPWPTDLTGIYLGSYLQSVAKNFAIGMETVWQRPSPNISSTTTSYVAKWTGDQKDWIATAHIQPGGVVQATYWQKLGEKVEVAAEMNIVATPSRRDAIATLGAKYDLRLSTFRAQIDSTGKVAAFLEQRFTPAFAFLLSGEIDHFKNAAKVGVGVTMDSTTLTPEEMGLPQHGP